ncbi:maltokinase N-terminal cap-like domain-containing protein [Yinghuangia sp. YIM S09857]|uniref:maltokinase N-terminal cap-like domain-containing protein n=1 Tax=Yinghuangia sp. YIM S09857 TaxID=3436929 RepID=UPI003F5387EF
MAVIHHTTLTPTKLELLTAWLPDRPWYAGGLGTPDLTRAGGFRLDDPRGEVGIEFLVVTDTSHTSAAAGTIGAGTASPAAYLIPLTYRGAPLDGAEHALVGTMEHGVLGPRWAYDGCHDPVLVGQLAALIAGRVQAQDQSASDTPDPEVTRTYAAGGDLAAAFASGSVAADGPDGTELRSPHGPVIHLHRALRAVPDGAPAPPDGATGHVAGHWRPDPQGPRVRGLFAVLHGGAGA